MAAQRKDKLDALLQLQVESRDVCQPFFLP